MQEKIFGKVVHGLGKGAGFGFPTVNIELVNNTLRVENGVYAVTITVDNRQFKGMLYAGTRPTLNLMEQTIEVHIFQFNENIYNQQIYFQILHKIRDEIKFNSIEELIKQLHQDQQTVYNFFSYELRVTRYELQ
jgi:riboflavin kinase/FMN adenylyltransferase